ncbi:ESX secretion-associated protein EspG [Nocardia rosealba]|uniref:ESX secretion-associated protein EspG n=1 Tax=Nocardia TaxID=1817 RepID=UPI001CD9EBD7|nr:ESX secretion-associated protein EspG [Nocardia rosealba]MCA2206226.1 ESX secretion-associated protein EspG [Nocardia rosealba]
MNWHLTPDQFALAWARTDGDRIPYPLAVRASARDTAERAAARPALDAWCARTLDPDLSAALRVLAKPEIRVEVCGHAPAPVRMLGAVAGDVAVLAVQSPGIAADRGGDLHVQVGATKRFAPQVFSRMPRQPVGTGPRIAAPAARVREDSRDLVTVPVAGPSDAARIRKLLQRPRTGIGQILVAPGADEPATGVLSWIDVTGDGRYLVHSGHQVSVAPATPDTAADWLRRLLRAA